MRKERLTCFYLNPTGDANDSRQNTEIECVVLGIEIVILSNI